MADLSEIQKELDYDLVERLKAIQQNIDLLKSLLRGKQDKIRSSVSIINTIGGDVNDLLFDLTKDNFYKKKFKEN